MPKLYSEYAGLPEKWATPLHTMSGLTPRSPAGGHRSQPGPLLRRISQLSPGISSPPVDLPGTADILRPLGPQPGPTGVRRPETGAPGDRRPLHPLPGGRVLLLPPGRTYRPPGGGNRAQTLIKRLWRKGRGPQIPALSPKKPFRGWKDSGGDFPSC